MKKALANSAVTAVLLALSALAANPCPAQDSEKPDPNAETTAVPPASSNRPQLSEPEFIMRISYLPGFAGGVLVKDGQNLAGSSIDLRRDLHSDAIGNLISISAGLKTGSNIWAFVKAGELIHAGGTSSSRPFNFDGVACPGGEIGYSLRLLNLDLSLVAMSGSAESYFLGIGLGLKLSHLETRMNSPLSGAMKETNDGIYPFMSLRGRVGLTRGIEIEAAFDFGIFAYASEEVISSREETVLYVDPYGNPVGQEKVTSERSRYLVNRYNAFLDLYAGFRFSLEGGFGIGLGYRFFYINGESSGGGLQEDSDLRINGLELTLFLEF